MKNIKLKDFIENSNINSTLIKSVVNNMGGWEYFKENADNVTEHGAAGGFGGFIYYTDTMKFARRNKTAIIQLCESMDEQMENVGLLSFISSFNCLNDISQDSIAKAIYTGKGEDVTQVLNALAWFALEEISRAYVDFAA